MMLALLAILAQVPVPTRDMSNILPGGASSVATPQMVDGGYALQVTCDNCSSEAGPGGASWFPDGGSIGSVDVSNFPASFSVSNFPASQTVSGSLTCSGPLTDTQLRASALPVTGTMEALQGTSPWVVSLISTTITGSVAVTGAFWQATQPVSGTFWQATQPVSGTLTCNAGTGTLAVSGAFFQATQPVSLATAPALVASTAQIGTVKKTENVGRTLLTLTADNVVPILTTDTIVTFGKLVGDTFTGAQTTYAVTSGKTLRITGITFTMIPSSTTPAHIRLRLRTLSSGACIVATSVVAGVWSLSSPPGTLAANAGGNVSLSIPFPDGIEFSGASRNVCLSMNALGAAAQTVTITVTGYEYTTPS